VVKNTIDEIYKSKGKNTVNILINNNRFSSESNDYSADQMQASVRKASPPKPSPSQREFRAHDIVQ